MPNVPFDERSNPGLYKLCITGVRELGGCLVQRGFILGLYTAGELPNSEGPEKDRNLPRCQTRDTKSDGSCKALAKGQHGCKPDGDQRSTKLAWAFVHTKVNAAYEVETDRQGAAQCSLVALVRHQTFEPEVPKFNTAGGQEPPRTAKVPQLCTAGGQEPPQRAKVQKVCTAGGQKPPRAVRKSEETYGKARDGPKAFE